MIGIVKMWIAARRTQSEHAGHWHAATAADSELPGSSSGPSGPEPLLGVAEDLGSYFNLLAGLGN